MFRLAICFLFILCSCTLSKQVISYTSRTTPIYIFDPPPQKILLLNTFNVAAKKYRDNKEELFLLLIDSLMTSAATRIFEETSINTQVIKGFTSTAGNDDSAVTAFIKTNKASHAITVNFFDVYFYQTGVDVTKETDGSKHREAFYDIVNDINYSFYSVDSLIVKKDVRLSRFHSSRSVASGLLAAGPNIVVQKEDAYRIAKVNVQQYLNYFFPGEKVRHRFLFIGKGFEAVKLALTKHDYEAALIENMRLIADANKEKAAKANYNCAVLFEKKNQPDEAKKYLQRSLSLAQLIEANLMWKDFE